MRLSKNHLSQISPTNQSKRGSFFIEALFLFTGIFSLLPTGLFLIYVSFLHVWLQHSLYEGLLCLSKPSLKRSLCQRTTKRHLQVLLPYGSLHSFQLKEKPFVLNASLHWSLFHFTFQNSLSLKKEDIQFSLTIPEALL